MALKRINKELTDLGRYVYDFSFTAALKKEVIVVGCIASGVPGNIINNFTFEGRIHNEEDHLADDNSIVVTHRPPAQQVLSEMIWYVRLDAGKMAISTTHNNMRQVLIARRGIH